MGYKEILKAQDKRLDLILERIDKVLTQLKVDRIKHIEKLKLHK